VPDLSSNQPADVRLFVSLDVHKNSIVAAALPPSGGGQPEVQRIETTEKAIRRFVTNLGGPRAGRDPHCCSRGHRARNVVAVSGPGAAGRRVRPVLPLVAAVRAACEVRVRSRMK
jgi:hypothetical protein